MSLYFDQNLRKSLEQAKVSQFTLGIFHLVPAQNFTKMYVGVEGVNVSFSENLAYVLNE